ncbi:MAG: urate hydroxylase PuuD [Proteobacteria bacterium]|nr:urate hydroxylase PuuD [Pseudomonadota bacterium]
MSAFLADWLNLLIRWGHMIAGIGWIGASFYFIALDRSLKRREKMQDGVLGSAWEVHGGGRDLGRQSGGRLVRL